MEILKGGMVVAILGKKTDDIFPGDAFAQYDRAPICLAPRPNVVETNNKIVDCRYLDEFLFPFFFLFRFQWLDICASAAHYYNPKRSNDI